MRRSGVIIRTVEMTSGLDTVTRRALLNLLADLQHGSPFLTSC
ncbi:hypothetical protein ACWGN5_10385 [Streptomyces sp. NPDC055815]